MRMNKAIKDEVMNDSKATVKNYLIKAKEIKEELKIDIDEVELTRAMVEVEKSTLLGMGFQLLTESIRPKMEERDPEEIERETKAREKSIAAMYEDLGITMEEANDEL